MSEAYRAAIEMGARALDEIVFDGQKGFSYTLRVKMAETCLAAIIPHAIPERCDAELQERVTRRVSDLTTGYPNAVANGVNDGLALLRTRMTPPAKPVETPKPPADDEQVKAGLPSLDSIRRHRPDLKISTDDEQILIKENEVMNKQNTLSEIYNLYEKTSDESLKNELYNLFQKYREKTPEERIRELETEVLNLRKKLIENPWQRQPNPYEPYTYPNDKFRVTWLSNTYANTM
jgi:hypothetical protein